MSFMDVCQTIRSLVAARARLGAIAVACLGVGLLSVVPAAAQGHGPGGPGRPGGMRGNFAAPPPSLTPRMPPHVGLQLGLEGRWWDDAKTVHKLNLRSDQQRRMDDIFEANKPTLLNLYGNVQREEAHLASLPAGDLQDETKVFAAIDRVAQARTDLEKAKVHLLLQIRQQLDPDQLAQLDREIVNSR
jgi:Spy/CpxP family protein refolding chaperone